MNLRPPFVVFYCQFKYELHTILLANGDEFPLHLRTHSAETLRHFSIKILLLDVSFTALCLYIAYEEMKMYRLHLILLGGN